MRPHYFFFDCDGRVRTLSKVFGAYSRHHTCTLLTHDQIMNVKSVYLSREFQGSFPSSLTCPQKAGMGWEGHASVCTKLCPGKDRTERFPKVCLFIMRDSDVRTVLSVWVSFSVSQIVPLHVLFRWLVKWDIAGSPFTLACYCLSTCSPWPPPLALVQSLGVRRYR